MLAEMEAAQSALVEFAALKDALESVRGQLAKATLELEEAKRRQPESESARYVRLAQEALAAARSPPASECEPPCVGTRAPTLPMDDGQLAAYQGKGLNHRITARTPCTAIAGLVCQRSDCVGPLSGGSVGGASVTYLEHASWESGVAG